MQRTLVQAMTLLGDDPRPHGVEKMTGGENEYRIREGDYRVVYTIRDAALIVLIVRVGHRKDIYR
ncbi:MAG: type II toxin-antitoxin system RelE/ParE family toxin [Chloroflexota bacterium]|nr:type II toxin-antitoxin system RelE/ParE family toxin [Chloroflexota bacterium]